MKPVLETIYLKTERSRDPLIFDNKLQSKFLGRSQEEKPKQIVWM